MAASSFWTGSANLPLLFVEHLFQTYVHPSICFGLEFVTVSPQLAHFQTRLLQWGRRMPGWLRGSPSLAVQGQLAWHDACTTRLILAAGLWARLLSLRVGVLQVILLTLRASIRNHGCFPLLMSWRALWMHVMLLSGHRCKTATSLRRHC